MVRRVRGDKYLGYTFAIPRMQYILKKKNGDLDPKNTVLRNSLNYVFSPVTSEENIFKIQHNLENIYWKVMMGKIS